MQVVLIDAYPVDDPDRAVVGAATEALAGAGHQIDRLGLAEAGFEPFMSPEERAAYHSDQPLVAGETKAAAELVTEADALLLCYPTVTFTVPALLKGWLERVMVMGVAFVFDDEGRVAPGLKRVRRLGVVTTSPHGWLDTRRHRDPGRRTIMRTLRLSCNRRCRRTFLSIPSGAGSQPSTEARIARALRRW